MRFSTFRLVFYGRSGDVLGPLPWHARGMDQTSPCPPRAARARKLRLASRDQSTQFLGTPVSQISESEGTIVSASLACELGWDGEYLPIFQPATPQTSVTDRSRNNEIGK